MMKIRSSSDGAELAYDVAGAGPPIVLSHPFPLSRVVWDAQAERLAARARVIRYDHRGLGESDVPPGPYLMETLAGDLADVLDAADAPRAIVVGHSLGGFVAYAFARMFAERVAGLGILQSRASEDDDAQRAARFALADRIDAQGTDALVDALLPSYLAADRYERDPAMVVALRRTMRQAAPQGAAALLRGMAARVASDDLFTEFGAFPVAIVAAAADRLVPVETLRAEAARIPDARFTVVRGGHLPQWEAPDELGDALEALCDAAAPRA